MFKRIFSKAVFSLMIFALPLITGAQDADLGNIKDLIQSIGDIIAILLPIVIGLGIVIFIWGLIKRLFSDDDDARKQGWKYMGFGILIIFVAVSLVGLVEFVGRALGVDQGGELDPPCLEGLNCPQDRR